MNIELRKQEMINANRLIENAAMASQNKSIIDDPATTGAILRSVAQWLNHNRNLDHNGLIDQLKEHKSYDR